MNEQRLLVIKNVTEETITDSWDGKPFDFAPGEPVTVELGLGLHFKDRHPGALELVEEKRGIPPDHAVTEVRLVNPTDEPLTLYWDGKPYVFAPGEPVSLDPTLAHVLQTTARAVSTPVFPKGVQLQLVTDTPPQAEPTVSSVSAPEKKPVRRSRR